MGTVDVTGERFDWDPPTVLPPGWRMLDRTLNGARYRNWRTRHTVIITISREQDGRRWLHFSCSHIDRIPKWGELVDIKEVFLGTKVFAYQVIPPRAEYVNQHPNVLHLWHCLDDIPMPDFTRGSGQL